MTSPQLTTHGTKRASASSQPLLSPSTLEALVETSSTLGAERNDVTELLLMSAMARLGIDELETSGDVAHGILSDLRSGDYVALPRIDRKRSRTYPENVASNATRFSLSANVIAFRMAHRQDFPDELVPGETGYARPGIGMSFGMTAEDLWQRSRGYWRITPDAEYVVPTRLGFAPYVYVAERWNLYYSRGDEGQIMKAKYWARDGWLIDVANDRLVPLNGSPERSISERDRLVGRQLTGKTVRFPQGVLNPAIWVGRTR